MMRTNAISGFVIMLNSNWETKHSHAWGNLLPEKLRLDQLISDLQSTVSIDDTWSAVAEYARSVGFEHVNYVKLHCNAHSARTTTFSNFPIWWQEVYFAEHLIVEDIIIKHCEDLRPKLVDIEKIDDDATWCPIIRERLYAMREIGFINGFVSPTGTTDADRASGWCFGSSMNKTDFVKAYAKHGVTLRLAGLCAHERLEAMEQASSALRTSDSELSGREQECLTHVALGNRSPTIARVMGISLSTVEFHIKRIKEKLQAATREEAVAKAIAFGHISYPA